LKPISKDFYLLFERGKCLEEGEWLGRWEWTYKKKTKKKGRIEILKAS